MLNDESEEVRTAAIIALGQIGDKDSDLANMPSIPTHLSKTNTITCSHCGKSVGKDFTFCPFCLEQLKPTTCRNCGKQLESGWKGCPYCGMKI
jgi:RNA polymerase subunit RPABC4/transcription elongation factor Spt4